MEKCSFFPICESPSKRKNGWACSLTEKERKKMCVMYLIILKKGWVEPETKIPSEEIKVGLV